ncbi:MAG: lipoyl synthase [Bacteroidota bacterium]|nr:lipoyl synthase [Bacteroidota bacterium]MDP4229324.1 lipoyl synthase [Bacteroidota bacterium]MDP4237669.1 lipoyl synthase [Bacteroidota bacterium]
MLLDLPVITPSKPREPRPEWLKVRIPSGENYSRLKNLMHEHDLHTVCEEARCPNVAECWNSGTATFMILGDTCTRSCGFCAVKTGRPTFLDTAEPERVAEAARLMNLRHVVITSVNRDELADGGAGVFAETIRATRKSSPKTRIEVLIPDFKGKDESLKLIFDARPDILNHNTETVPSMYRMVRPQAKYQWSLKVLRRAKEEGFISKTGIMLGLGESRIELVKVMADLVEIKVDILTLGQYLQPSPNHLPVHRFLHPDEFKELHDIGMDMGFRNVEAGPLVRSSYHAEQHI